MTRIVDGLEQAALAERHPHPKDGRATLVRATKKGPAGHGARPSAPSRAHHDAARTVVRRGTRRSCASGRSVGDGARYGEHSETMSPHACARYSITDVMTPVGHSSLRSVALPLSSRRELASGGTAMRFRPGGTDSHSESSDGTSRASSRYAAGAWSRGDRELADRRASRQWEAWHGAGQPAAIPAISADTSAALTLIPNGCGVALVCHGTPATVATARSHTGRPSFCRCWRPVEIVTNSPQGAPGVSRLTTSST